MWRMRNKKEYGNNGIDYVPRMRTLRATLGTFLKKLNTRFCSLFSRVFDGDTTLEAA
jgi:hypothetical protein